MKKNESRRCMKTKPDPFFEGFVPLVSFLYDQDAAEDEEEEPEPPREHDDNP